MNLGNNNYINQMYESCLEEYYKTNINIWTRGNKNMKKKQIYKSWIIWI